MEGIIISVWQPWNVRKSWHSFYSLAELMEPVRLVPGAAVSIKGYDLFHDKSNPVGLYGATPEWSLFEDAAYQGRSNDDLEQVVKGEGRPLDAWCYIRLQHPIEEARGIKDVVTRWQVRSIDLDAEIEAEQNRHNVGTFLRELGVVRDRTGRRVPVRLQSWQAPFNWYRWPNPKSWWHRMEWHKWLTYQAEGEYIITGLSPQLYPEPVEDPGLFATRYQQSIEMYQHLIQVSGRDPGTLDWRPTIPTYQERGWRPPATALESGVRRLQDLLGDRLVGLNAFRLGFLLDPAFEGHLALLIELASEFAPDEPELPDPGARKWDSLEEHERWEAMALHLEHDGLLDEERRLPGDWEL